jgi:hypothetical protein
MNHRKENGKEKTENGEKCLIDGKQRAKADPSSGQQRVLCRDDKRLNDSPVTVV